MTNDSEPRDELVDRRLREAYREIAPRPEFIERVHAAVTSELDASLAVDQSTAAQPTARRMRSQLVIAFLSLAATWLIAVIVDRSKTSNLTKASPNDLERHEDHQVIHGDSRDTNTVTSTSVESIQNSRSIAVNGSAGYLAGKIYDDPDVEVYVVLPTDTANLHIE